MLPGLSRKPTNRQPGCHLGCGFGSLGSGTQFGQWRINASATFDSQESLDHWSVKKMSNERQKQPAGLALALALALAEILIFSVGAIEILGVFSATGHQV
jgi:hypothetical protein